VTDHGIGSGRLPKADALVPTPLLSEPEEGDSNFKPVPIYPFRGAGIQGLGSTPAPRQVADGLYGYFEPALTYPLNPLKNNTTALRYSGGNKSNKASASLTFNLRE